MDNVLTTMNYITVIGAALAGYAVGALWYSPILLGKEWMEGMNITPEDIKKKGPQMKIIYSLAFLQTIIKALFLGILFKTLGVQNGYLGAYLGLFLCIGFTATSIGINYLFEGKSMDLTWITIGHHMAAFMVMGGILGAWG